MPVFEMEAIERLRLKPGDIIILRHPQPLSLEAVARLKEDVIELCPGHQVVVLEEGFKFEVIPAGDVKRADKAR